MKIVQLGFKSATVADMGLKAAARTMGEFTNLGYDPFAGCSEREICDWLLFALFLVRNDGGEVAGVCGHVEWLCQGPLRLDQWLGAEGEKWRQKNELSNLGKPFLERWASFKAANHALTQQDIEAALDAAEAAQKAVR